jgi:hypothetical protein
MHVSALAAALPVGNARLTLLAFGLSLICSTTCQSMTESTFAASDPFCQLPGTCAFCPVCPTCTEGPGGFPSGCGFCRFCSSFACPPRQCVANEANVTITSTSNDCMATNANLEAEVLVLDVNSWESYSVHTPPRVTTALECCDLCKNTTDCNAWTFCFRPEGCGEGCVSNKTTGLPGVRSQNCIELGPHSFCGKNGTYPYLMCSLKRVSDFNNITFYPNGEEWTSGVVRNDKNQSTAKAFTACT